MLGKQMEQAQKTKGDQENQPAFRILFDDEDQLMGETSPQFKKV